MPEKPIPIQPVENPIVCPPRLAPRGNEELPVLAAKE